MKGSELRAAILDNGFSLQDFAGMMGVHRTTLSRQFQQPKVDEVWRFALAGAVAVKASDQIQCIARS